MWNPSLEFEAYGMITKDKQISEVLRPKLCPNCNESKNEIVSFVLSAAYDAYSETLESEKQKEDKLSNMEEYFAELKNEMDELKQMMMMKKQKD
jgi:hypothetical protein